MLIGKTILAEMNNFVTNPTVVWTPWFSRQGDGAASSFEVISISPSNMAQLTVKMYHKSSSETGDGSENAAVSGTVSTYSNGVFSFRNTGCKQLVRYRILLAEGSSAPQDGALFAHFRILPPSWQYSGVQGL